MNQATQNMFTDSMIPNTSASQAPSTLVPVTNLPALWTLDQADYPSDAVLTIEELEVRANAFTLTEYNRGRGAAHAAYAGMIQLSLHAVEFTTLQIHDNTAINVLLVNLPNSLSYFGMSVGSSILRNDLYGGAAIKVQDSNSGVFQWENMQPYGETNIKIDDFACQYNEAYISPAPCLEITMAKIQEPGEKRRPWINARVTNGLMEENSGSVVNDLYYDHSVRDMYISDMEWYIDLDRTSSTKQAQVIYKDPGTAQFDDRFEGIDWRNLTVKDSVFRCTQNGLGEQQVNQTMIMQFDANHTIGRPSLFHIVDQNEENIYVPGLDF
jgi:hypothetical protein